MALISAEPVIPRPGQAFEEAQKPIPAPTETAFTDAFGKLLPSAQFLQTDIGRAAYYELPPSTNDETTNAPHRVLLVHGVQTPALGLLPLARALQSSHPNAHLVLLDLWGHGLSDTPVVPHDIPFFHRLIDTLLSQLSWPSAHLIGYSFGGSTVTTYLAARPERVQSLTAVAPAGLIRLSGIPAEEQTQLFSTDDKVAKTWLLNFLEGGDLIVPADWKDRVAKGEIVVEAVKEWQMKNHRGHFSSVLAMFRDGGVLDRDEEITRASKTGVPSLVVLGEMDGFVKEDAWRECGFGNIETVKNVGHGVVRDRVEEVAGLIGQFWEGLE